MASDEHVLGTVIEAATHTSQAFCRSLTAAIQGPLTDAAKYLEEAGLSEEGDKVFEGVKEILRVDAKIKAHEKASETLLTMYEFDQTHTDFKKYLKEWTRDILESEGGIDPEADERYKAFCEEVRPGAGGGAGDDQELVIQRGQQPAINAFCPLSRIEVLKLREPVEDDKGYVYEKEAVVDYITRESHHRRQVPCPQAGTTHYISLESLVPARRVLKAQRRRARFPERPPPPAAAVDIE
uniref:SP-RING-type domain-containing protein n=1 Tax=Tetraselmis sp. GSL018 TaxID=582737 RepID=A0A061R632_9CHLO|mmetsp:Transcript_7255/g.17419  ORF Transcript_7255/g.17419 Transcript_7255/m.17419 type:complete len:239 (-) Transcript_7255:139-855(-)